MADNVWGLPPSPRPSWARLLAELPELPPVPDLHVRDGSDMEHVLARLGAVPPDERKPVAPSAQLALFGMQVRHDVTLPHGIAELRWRRGRDPVLVPIYTDHHLRFLGGGPEDCPCEPEPCGDVSVHHADPRCDWHPLDALDRHERIVSMHRSDVCPALDERSADAHASNT